MSIKDFVGKIKPYWANFKDKHISPESGLKIKDDLYIVLMIILVGTASYGLGMLSSFEKDKTPISILKTKESMYATALTATNNVAKNTQTNKTNETLVASKSGTKYYYTWCSGVSRIKEENKIYFDTVEQAKANGLTPAANCEGLK